MGNVKEFEKLVSRNEGLRIIFVGGGTAGHINPALALADYIREKDLSTEILYVGAKGGMEETLVPKAGFKFKSITASGFVRKFSFSAFKKNVVALLNIFTADRESQKILKEFRPNLCVGTGGYVSGAFLRRAKKMRIPFLIHEQNAYPGITTKLLSKKANKVLLASKMAAKYLNPNLDIIITGNPLRKDIGKVSKNEAKCLLGMDDKPIILSFAGSLGAGTVNEAVAELIIWSRKKGLFNHIHAYGKYGAWMPIYLEKKKINNNLSKLDIRPYIDNMSVCMAATDVVICRAGAITLSELKRCAKPSILVPSPNVAENHQYHNAMEFVNAGAAMMLEEKDLNGSVLIETLRSAMANISNLQKGIEKLKSESCADSAEVIYNIIRDLAKKNA